MEEDEGAPGSPHSPHHRARTTGSALLRGRGLDRLIPAPHEILLAGFSFGGIVGGLAAARPGSRIRTLVLLGSGGLGLPPLPTPGLLPVTSAMAPDEITHAHRENLCRLMIADPRKADDLAVLVHMDNLRRARFKSGTIPSSSVLLNALPAIQARIAGIWSGRDAFAGCRAERVDAQRRVLASVQPDIDFRVIAGAGHWTPYEAADEVHAALLDMLA